MGADHWRAKPNWLLRSVCSLLFLASIAVAATPPSEESVKFAQSASQQISAQLQAAQLARTRSADPVVREFAAELAADNEQADRALEAICQQANVDVVVRTDSSLNALPAQAGSGFDRIYTLEVSQALAKAERLFDTAARSPRVDARLKEFARQRIEDIREHRKRADELARKQAAQR
jgi:putative membrane protein